MSEPDGGVTIVEPEVQPDETQKSSVSPDLAQPSTSIVPAVVRNSLAEGTRTLARDIKSGRFAKKRNKLDQELKTSEKLEREIQAVLDSPVIVEGKALLDSKTNKPISLHVAVEQNLLEICRTSRDPKMLSGAAKLLDILFNRAHGRVKESPANRDALATSGISTVVIKIPSSVPEGPAERPAKPKLPSWAELSTINAEVVSTNEAPKRPSRRPEIITPEIVADPVPTK